MFADLGRVSSTLCALSSVARLSVSMTMLMSSGIYRSRHNTSTKDECASSARDTAAACTAVAPFPPAKKSRFYRPGSVIVGGRFSTRSTKNQGASKRSGTIVGRSGRSPSRFESLPNIRNGGTGAVARSDQPSASGARFKASVDELSEMVEPSTVDCRRKRGDVDVARHLRCKDTGDGHGSSDLDDYGSTSGDGSSVSIDIEPIYPSAVASAVDVSAHGPTESNHALQRDATTTSPVTVDSRPSRDDSLCRLQSPVNSSGIRIVINSGCDVETDHRLTDVDRVVDMGNDGPAMISVLDGSTTASDQIDNEDIEDASQMDSTIVDSSSTADCSSIFDCAADSGSVTTNSGLQEAGGSAVASVSSAASTTAAVYAAQRRPSSDVDELERLLQ